MFNAYKVIPVHTDFNLHLKIEYSVTVSIIVSIIVLIFV